MSVTPFKLNQALSWFYEDGLSNPLFAAASLGLVCFVLMPLSPFIWVASWTLAAYILVQSSLWQSAKNVKALQMTDEIVLVTGGSNGVGLELVNKLVFEQKVKKVIVLDLLECPVDSDRVSYFKCDVSNREMVKTLAAEIIAEFGHPTVLVNNAGVIRGKNLIDLTEKDIDLTMGVNIMSHFHLIKAFLPGFLAADRGHIVSMASIMGTVGSPKLTDYCASKFAVIGMCESLRQELRNTNVHVSYLCPGFIDSGMFNGFQNRFDWIAPALPVDYVASRLVKVIQNNTSQVVKIPFYCNLVYLTQHLGLGWADWCSDFMGVSQGLVALKPSLSTQKLEKEN